MKYTVVQIRFTQVELVGKPRGAQQTGLVRTGLGTVGSAKLQNETLE